MLAQDLLKLDRPPRKRENARAQQEPQTARALLEENKWLVSRKKEEKALARKNSREFVDKILLSDQKVIEADRAKNASRRVAQQELARYYKSRIAEKELDKANEYRAKLSDQIDSVHFPYSEGEKINQTRKLQNAQLREEMRGFLKDQREAKPPRADRLMNGDPNYMNKYDAKPSSGDAMQELRNSMTPNSNGLSNGMTPNIKHPRFLKRPGEHMSRRIQDEHVRKALEDKVQRTKEELEKVASQRLKEAQLWEQGMLVNDALRYDFSLSKSADRAKNAQFLVEQMDERRSRDKKEVQDYRSQCAGYWGPEEKEPQDVRQHVSHCADLIKQMEVNQNRRLDSRNRRLVQEKRLVDNSLAEICQDRDLERQKNQLHREVLVTTWDSQRKIREVMDRIEEGT